MIRTEPCFYGLNVVISLSWNVGVSEVCFTKDLSLKICLCKIFGDVIFEIQIQKIFFYLKRNLETISETGSKHYVYVIYIIYVIYIQRLYIIRKRWLNWNSMLHIMALILNIFLVMENS